MKPNANCVEGCVVAGAVALLPLPMSNKSTVCCCTGGASAALAFGASTGGASPLLAASFYDLVFGCYYSSPYSSLDSVSTCLIALGFLITGAAVVGAAFLAGAAWLADEDGKGLS